MTPPPPSDRLFLDFQSAVAGRYSLERELGRGGMGVVYLAREVRLDRPVAIKLLPPSKTVDPKLRERFLKEARTAARLSHPNIIPIYAVEEVGEFVFFAMAFVDGETLTERVRRRGPLTPSEAARVLREVAWALAHAHAQGVIHRDVKSDNIMLETETGRAVVTDFGIAGVVAGAGALTAGEVVGTPEFMSPEQALGTGVNARSDLYSLGIVGYFVLSGRLPFEAGRATEVLAKQVTEPPPRVAEATSGVPRRLAQAIDRCLAKDPAERPEGTAALAEELSRSLEQRRELPVALRVFVASRSDISEGQVIAVVVLIVAGFGIVMNVLEVFGLDVGAGWWKGLAATIFGGAIVAPLALAWRDVRRLAKTGFRPDDIARAFQDRLDRQGEERRFEHGAKPSLFERTIRIVALASISFAVLTGGLLWTDGGYYEDLWQWFPSALIVAMGSGLITVMRLHRRKDIASRLWKWIWSGPVGRTFYELATIGQRTPTLASATHRSTELSLGMAVEDLFGKLPRESKHELRDLPDVVRRLEGDAQRMRRRLEVLQDALANSGHNADDSDVRARHDRILADLTAERDLVQQRLRDAVAALETIRLNLLRLHAGTGSVHSLTTDLGLAREVAQDIDLLLEGQRAVEEELRR